MPDTFEGQFVLGVCTMMIFFILSFLTMVMLNSAMLTILMWVGMVAGVVIMINAIVFTD